MKACPTRTFPQKSTWTKQTNKQHKRVFFPVFVLFSEPLLTKDFAGLQTNQGMHM